MNWDDVCLDFLMALCLSSLPSGENLPAVRDNQKIEIQQKSERWMDGCIDKGVDRLLDPTDDSL